MKTIFEKYPLPWTCPPNSPQYIMDANGNWITNRPLPSELVAYVIQCSTALADIQNPVQWVADLTDIQFEHVDLLKEYAKQKQRIAELEQQVAHRPVPIKPLEWQKNDAFQWAQGVNCHYEFWYRDCLFWIRSASPTEPISVPVEDAVILAQAHHETQVLSLLNLPE